MQRVVVLIAMISATQHPLVIISDLQGAVEVPNLSNSGTHVSDVPGATGSVHGDIGKRRIPFEGNASRVRVDVQISAVHQLS